MVVGVDFDEEMVTEAVKLAQEAGVSAWVIHRQGNSQSLPYADATFDACRAERLFQVLPSASILNRSARKSHAS